MKKENIEYIDDDKIEILDPSEYIYDIEDYYKGSPDMMNPLINNAKNSFKKIEKALYSTPAFVDAIKSMVPDETLQAVLSKEQKEMLASGAVKLMTKKDGSLMANLVDPNTKRIVQTIKLENIKMNTDINKAINNFSTQMQMAEIANEIQYMTVAIEEVRQGQENDRLAIAYSCQQRFLQAIAIKDKKLKEMALLNLISDTENCRNQLMLSQKTNLEIIKDEPEDFIGKLVNGTNQDKINKRMDEIRGSLCAVNMVSFAQAMAYQEMGELDAARISLKYYGEYIQKSYLEDKGLIQRLDLLDSSPKQYWSKTLPSINKKINLLPCMDSKGIEER